MLNLKKILLILVLIVGFFAAQQSEAATIDDMVRKLGRGVCNTALGALEIPVKIWQTNREDGGLAAVTYGVFKGIVFFIGRELVGVTEIVTFPLPLPGCPKNKEGTGWGYGPIMYPEFIIDPSTDPFSTVFPETEVVI